MKLDEDPERTVAIPITATDQDGASERLTTPAFPPESTFAQGRHRGGHSPSARHPTHVDDDGESVKLTFGNEPPHRGVCQGFHRRGRCEHHGRRRAVNVSSELRAWDSYTVDEGSNVHGKGEAGRRS